MKLFEYQGKDLFQKYGIAVPKAELISSSVVSTSIQPPFVLKAQVLSGDRMKKGGIAVVEKADDFVNVKNQIFQIPIDGELPEKVLVEEKVQFQKEFYVSFSYNTDTRTPVLSVAAKGGTGIKNASIFPVDLIEGLKATDLQNWLAQAEISASDELIKVIAALWKLFAEEKALLAEINPLFELKDGSFVAGDAKIILDDNVVNPQFRPFLDLEGDIAILASGGGASLINLDALLKHGGRPANYVEYSGNPPAAVVEELTVKVLSKPNLKGCWVIGGTANFTDIYETLTGFVQGLRKIKPHPTFPIVIRRDGPRQKEAYAMLKVAAKKEGYNFHFYGPETSMSESAKVMVNLAYQ